MALRRTDGSYTGNLEERTSFQLETHFKNEEKSINRSFRGARSYSCTMDKKCISRVSYINTNATAQCPKFSKELRINYRKKKFIPGRKWYESFLKRHPDIVFRTSQNLAAHRKVVNQDAINKWFKEIESNVNENNLMSVLNDPDIQCFAVKK